MKAGVLIAWMLVSVGAIAAESEPPSLPRCNQAPRAWLGLRVSKPDAAITAQMPALPPGVGFVVDAVDADGPAAAAGLRALDLMWKFDDQMLVNEAQLATLLRLAKPGEEVVLHGFRGGKPLEVKLTLGKAPLPRDPLGSGFAETAVLPDAHAAPLRVVNVSEKVTTFTADDGSASVRHDGNGYRVRIDGPADERIFHGFLARDSGIEAVPEPWRRRIQVLCRTLDRTITSEGTSTRQPRPRVVPPSRETR